jgi:protein tyrosine/serine phosphatase
MKWFINYLKTSSKKNSYGIPIANFGKVNDNLYRGALPDREGYRALAKFGINTIVNLIDKEPYYQMGVALGEGIKDIIHIPMSDSERPTPDQIKKWLLVVSDRKWGKIYVHCHGGRHRTGVLVAVYRVAKEYWYKWDAWNEAKRKFGYYDKPPILGKDHSEISRWFWEDFEPDDWRSSLSLDNA